MTEKRIVMEVTVIWVTDSSDETVKDVMVGLDAMGAPSPLDYISQAIINGAPEIDMGALNLEGTMEIRVSGPEKWSIAYDDR